MPTILENTIKKQVDNLMEDTDWMIVLSEYVRKMRSGYFHDVDVICQKWERLGKFDLYDAYSFSTVWGWMCNAEVVVARIFIGDMPNKDHHIKENNKILKKLGYPFSGEFWGGNQDEDGYIYIDSSIEFDMRNLETREMVVLNCEGHFPLEVGYISSAKTEFYLKTKGRLARWPYGYDEIWLMQKVGEYK